MLEKKSIFKINNLNLDLKTLSISRYDVIMEDGVEISASNPHTQGFSPGEIEDIKSFIGVTDSPEITYLESIWTPDVVAAWQLAQEQLNQEY